MKIQSPQLSRRSMFTRILPVVALLLVAAFSSYQVSARIGGPSSGTKMPAAAPAANQAFSAKLEFAPATAKIGDTIQFTGSDYPVESEVELVWYTVRGWYELENKTEFVGQRYEAVTEVITKVFSDVNGKINGSFTVPVGFGGPHDVRGRVAGEEVSQAGMMVTPTVTMTPTEGPIGTPIELKISGIDLRLNLNTWHMLYDSHYFGFLSGVTTNGQAVAHFRAAGAVGSHRIEVWNNSYQSTPYLAWDTGPFRNDFEVGQGFNFTVTADPGVIPAYVEDFSATDNPWPLETQVVGPGKLALSVDRGPVGQAITLTGSDLPANSEVDLVFWTTVGDRVSGRGYVDEPVDFGKVQVDADGKFVKEMTIPDDLGGYHRLEVAKDGQTLGATGLMIIPSIVSVTTQVKAGEQIEFHLKGVGWTTYDNTYTVTYDNAQIGYVCGFSTNGDVQFHITATGAPGTHVIDFYPTIYKGQDPMPRIYSMPQLTYADDHPARTLPAIRVTVEIVA